MELQTPRIYGIKNKAGNIGTLHLLKTQQAINNWKEDLTKQKKSLLEDKEHFNEKLTIYKEIYNKIKDKDGTIKKQIEQNEKILKVIQERTAEINELTIITIEQTQESTHEIKELCKIQDFILNWNEIKGE